jgi:hypothetical protein
MDSNRGEHFMGNVVRAAWPTRWARLANREKIIQAIVCREKTVQAIVSRIRELLHRYGQTAEADGLPCTVADFNGLFLLTAVTEKGTYFCVIDHTNRKQISGYYNLPEPKSKLGDCRNGTVNVTDWKRGAWEDVLFEY